MRGQPSDREPGSQAGARHLDVGLLLLRDHEGLLCFCLLLSFLVAASLRDAREGLLRSDVKLEAEVSCDDKVFPLSEVARNQVA